MTSDSPKTVLITGANAGLGYACARKIALSCPNHTVVLAGHSTERVDAAAQKLAGESSAKIIPMVVDLSSLASVRLFAQEVRAALPPLHCLVCNAGIRPTQHTSASKDGYESVFAVNYLGHFLLTQLLLPHMTDAGRIILLSSRTHNYRDVSPFPKAVYKKPAELAVPHPAPHEDEKSFVVHAYSNSKLCLTMFGFELARRMQAEGKNILVNIFDPGAMATSLMRDYNLAIRVAMHAIWPAMRLLPNMSATGASAQVMAELAVSEKYNGVTGKYFTMKGSYRRGAKEGSPSPLVFDLQKAKELWDGSEELVQKA